MLRFIPGPGRASLRFREAVVEAFRFLETEYQFARVEEAVTFVRYESERVFVKVYHGRGSYELGVEIGLRGTATPGSPTKEAGRVIGHSTREEDFSIWVIARSMGAADVARDTFLQASTAEGVQSLVPRLADVTRRYASTHLRGDAAAFHHTREWQAQEGRQLHHAMKLARVRERVAAAWREQNYPEVAVQLATIRDDLSPAEVKKLAYARKQAKMRE